MTSKRRSLLVVATLAVAVGVWGFGVEPRRVEPVRASISCPGGSGSSLRVLLFSDVSFRHVGVRERALLDTATQFDPDVVLIAGDFFDDAWVLDDPALRSLAGRLIASLPSRGGRFIVPGELEARHLDQLRSFLEPDTSVLVNASRRISLGDRCLDLFGALDSRDPPPWISGQEGRRRFVSTPHGPERPPHDLRLVVPGSERWKPRAVTLAFQAMTRHARVGVDIAGRLVERPASEPSPEPGVWYRARIELRTDSLGTQVRARFWKEGEPEPQAWAIDAMDAKNAFGSTGSIALVGLWGEETRYADIEVRGVDGEPLLRETFGAGWLARWDSGSALENWLKAKDDSPCLRVVLSHSPDVVRRVHATDAPRPCVVLAGHTHGGQVRLPGIGALYTSTWIGRRYDRGLFDFDGISLYITAGIGTTIVPIRLFDPPEVTLLTLGS